MNIKKLKSKRQLNVQEKNTLGKYQIYRQAAYWRNSGIPIGHHYSHAGR